MTNLITELDKDTEAKPISTISLGSRITGMFTSALLSPVMLFNSVAALLANQSILSIEYRTDALGRRARLLAFNKGFLKNSATLLQIAKGELNLCGASFSCRLSFPFASDLNQEKLPTGLISLHDCQEKTGLSVETPDALYVKQSHFKTHEYIALVLRFLFNLMWFRNGEEKKRALVPLFGLKINNTKMSHAINWFAHGEFFRGMPRYCTKLTRPRISFFVNANSVNLAQRNPAFKETLNRAHCLFADGSGMRLAAKTSGYKLLDNINGTDMLPLLCQEMQQKGKRLYLLGAAPGIAEKVQQNLERDFPNLVVCGTHHGYFKSQQNEAVIEQFNQTKADVLLVAQGSPLQESWIIENAHKLDCDSVIAVGGLLDFYSGSIPRAPMWMRETGLEWTWRLLQEPFNKFERYILGVPEFLFRTFILKQACQE